MADEEKTGVTEDPGSFENADFSKAFDVLEKMLSTEDGQNKISEIISAFSGGNTAGEGGIKEKDENNANFDGINLLNRLSSSQSNGAAFLQALKPFLKKERREKIDTVIKMTRAAALLKQMGFLNQGGGKNL